MGVPTVRKKHYPYILFLLLAVAVLGEGLQPGYLLLLDMPWPEQFVLSNYTVNGLSAHFPVTALFTLLSTVIPSWVVQKILLVSLLAGAGSSVYVLSRYIQSHVSSGPPKRTQALLSIAAGVLAILNPFVAERLLAGQWLVLAGYAFTPLVILFTLRMLESAKQTTKTTALYKNKSFWRFAVAYAALPIISIHWWYMATPLIALIIAVYVITQKIAYQRLLRPAAILVGLFILVNAFWMPHIISGNGTLDTITRQDFTAFQTVSDPDWGLTLNVVSLYGFWSDRAQLPKDFFSPWVWYGIGMFVLALIGAIDMKRRQSTSATALLIALPAVFILALGYGSGAGKLSIDVLQSIPGFSGLRDTAKVTGILALFVALFAPSAIVLLSRGRARIALTMFVVVTLTAMNGLLFGARGQLTPYDYPQSYREANALLSDINQPTIALPWQSYVRLDFADNRYVANPARSYFSPNITTSTVTGNRLLDAQTTDSPESLDAAALQPYNDQWSTDIIDNGHDHVLLLKTDSWTNYRDLLTDHTVIYDSAELAIIQLQ